MTATNSIAAKTGNTSAGTSIFTMIVLEKELSGVYTEIDMVTTPTGRPVAMVHYNTCTSDLDAWVNLFSEAISAVGLTVTKSALYDALYNSALLADSDCGDLLSYNYLAGEPITGLDEDALYCQNARKPLLTSKLYEVFTVLRCKHTAYRNGHPLQSRKGQC